jgi:hypothetical protein
MDSLVVTTVLNTAKGQTSYADNKSNPDHNRSYSRFDRCFGRYWNNSYSHKVSGLITLKLIKKSEPKQLESKELFPELDFKNVDQVLAKYKEKLSTKD